MADAGAVLDEIAKRLGFGVVPEVLEWASTPVRRGHHIALLAGEGSGKAAVVGLAVLEACDPADASLQALVLVAEADHARRVASALHRVVGPEGFRVACPSAFEDEREDAAAAQVLVGRPAELLPEIRSGHHPLGNLKLLVIEGVADLHRLGEWESVEPILETLPKENRKIAISDRPDPAFTRLIELQLPRARRWPEELLSAASPADAPAAVATDHVRSALVSPADFVAALERCVRDADGMGCGQVDVLFADAESAAKAASELAVAGLSVAREPGESSVQVALPGSGATAVVQVGLPFLLEELATAFAGEGPRYAVIEPRHAPQMELHLGRLGRQSTPLRGEALRDELDPVRRYRLLLREAATSADLMSELLVLEPLFEEFGAVRLAAVLSELYRGRNEVGDGPVRPWADVEAASTIPAGPATTRKRRAQPDAPVGVRPAWTRLYFGVGRRDDAKPGDLVGAITGEAGVAGAQVGKIEIMGNFSLVDVDSQVADAVLNKLDGATIRGRTVPVRRDREA